MKVFVKTYGCTFNQADSDEIKNFLKKKGFKIAGSEGEADAVVLNTCSVKAATQEKILHEIRSARGKKLVVAGCLAQVTPELALKANPNALVTGIDNGERIARALLEPPLHCTPEPKLKRFRPSAPVVDGVIARTRIARGCLNACAYCQTRIARGALESALPDEIIQGAARAVMQGAREVQLTAQDCGCYGFDLKPRATLASLVDALNCVPGDFRIRVGMLNPQHALKQLPELVSAFAMEKTYKFLHVPVQSGSDPVLRGMLRSYSAEDFKRIINAFRTRIPKITLATDVIAGYPTETDEDFRKTLELLEEIRFDIVNVSKFSPRPKTTAARLPQLNNAVVKRRSEEASALAKKISLEKNREWIGRTCNALFTEKIKAGSVSGRNDFYKPVILTGEGVEIGEFARVRIVGAVQGGLLAESA